MDSARQRDIAALETQTQKAINDLEQTIRAFDAGGEENVLGTDRATASMNLVRDVAGRLATEEDDRIEALRTQVIRDMWVAVGIALFTTVVTVAVLIGLNKLLQRHVAERARADAAIRETNQQLNQIVERRTAELRELSQHLIRISEEEKSKISRELHDTLGSNLTAINMDLNWILRRMSPDARELRERLQRSLQMLSETVELKHAVIEGLRPSHLYNLGLAFAMRAHCREFTRRTGLPCEVKVVEDFDELAPEWSITFYRIAQEALTNVAKHAQAATVRIELARESAGIRLRVIDDGVGLTEGAQKKPKSHGLVGMRERVRQLGGIISVAVGPDGTGTVVDAFVPYSVVDGRVVERLHVVSE